ncbi:MAG: VOC family protein [Hyphomicrobiales bacterium]
MKFHHLGIACKSISKTVAQFKAHHHNIVNISEKIHDPEQDATLQILTLDDRVRYEFISGNMVKGLIKKNIELYHVCFQVQNDLQEDIKRLVKGGRFCFPSLNPLVCSVGDMWPFLKPHTVSSS